MSKTVNGERVFGPKHKEVLRDILVSSACFSGVSVLTYCLMENHFHVLVRVPSNDEPSDTELIKRFRSLYSKPGPYQPLSADRLADTFKEGGAEADRLRESLMARMGDVSEFMKTLKQRFSIWFNQNHQRFGPLWSERFKSVLVEGGRYAISTVAAYIDLNPVRAGIVADPGKYPFSGYGKASLGGLFERSGIKAMDPRQPFDLKVYRNILFGKGRIPTREGEDDFAESASSSKMNPAPDILPSSAVLLQKLRHFSHGKVIGSLDYVQRMAKQIPWISNGRASKKPIPVPACQELYAATSVRRPRGLISTEEMSHP